MPPFKAVTSKKQGRKLFALARAGRISLAEAKGKVKAAKGKKLPEYAHAAPKTLAEMYAK